MLTYHPDTPVEKQNLPWTCSIRTTTWLLKSVRKNIDQGQHIDAEDLHDIMVPELVTAGYTTAQSDLYQLGLLMFQMHTGHPAIDPSASYEEIARQIAEGTPRQKAEALGTPFGNVVAKLLRRRDTYRYLSAREVWEDLRQLRWL